MFAKFTFVAVALAAFVAAAPTGSETDMEHSCNTGSMQCCNQTFDSKSKKATLLAGLLGIVLGDVDGMVGVSCSPLDVIGLSGGSCTQQPVCCHNNTYNGVIVIGCSPINVNL